MGPVGSASRVSSQDRVSSGSATKPSTLLAVKYCVSIGPSSRAPPATPHRQRPTDSTPPTTPGGIRADRAMTTPPPAPIRPDTEAAARLWSAYAAAHPDAVRACPEYTVGWFGDSETLGNTL